MARKRWSELNPRTRRIIVAAGAIDGALRILALKDLARRSDDDLNGSRKGWKNGLLFVNSAGILPIAYFLKARRSR